MRAALRRTVEERAGQRCEYCRLHHDFQPLTPFHVEHIVARQHGGQDSPENLALACHRCNLHKGPNLTGIDPRSGEVTRLFNPRQDIWTDHFELDEGKITGLTSMGRATAELLKMNSTDRVDLRINLLAAGLWK